MDTGRVVTVLLIVIALTTGPGTVTADPRGDVTVTVDPAPEQAGVVTVRVDIRRLTKSDMATMPWLSNATDVTLTGLQRHNETTVTATTSGEARLVATVRVGTTWGANTFAREERGSGFAGRVPVDGGSWAVVPEGNAFPVSLSGRPSVTDVRYAAPTTQTLGGMFLGETREFTRTVNGRPVTLVVPSEARQLKRRETTYEVIRRADGALRLGSPLPPTELLILPAGTSTHFAGRATGGMDRRRKMQLREEASQTTPHSTHIHEYVHTRQRFTTTDRTEWLVEASADYYAGLVATNLGYGSYESFYRFVSSTRWDDAVLSQPETWSDRRVPYHKGRHVLAALDTQIRTSTGGDRTLAAVFQRFDGKRIAHERFRRAVVRVSGNESLGPWVDRYVTTQRAPTVINRPDRFTIPTVEDADDDGLTTSEESVHETNPFRADTDGDDVADATEVDRNTDPRRNDTDGDGLQDGREFEVGTDPVSNDTDDDGLSDGVELSWRSDPLTADTDGDGLEDGEERDLGSDPRRVDSDRDGLEDDREARIQTDPAAADTDGDGLLDIEELRGATNATRADTDGDGHSDGVELRRREDPLVADTDRDGLPDEEEHRLGTDSEAGDTDGDGLYDPHELNLGTDPTNRDTDGDGYSDGREVRIGTDPSAATGTVQALRALFGASVRAIFG